MPKGDEIVGKASVNVYPKPIGGLQPRDFEGLWRMSQIMAASGMMPKGMERPEQVFVAVQAGMEVGLSPMQAVQNIAVINGRPSMWGDAALGLVRASGLLEYIEELPPDEALRKGFGQCRVKRIGEPEVVRTFSVEDAKKAKLFGKPGPWQDYAGRMLQLRARSWALRDAFPDVLKGLAIREEVQDIEVLAEVDSGVEALKNRLAEIKAASCETAKEVVPEEPPEAVVVDDSDAATLNGEQAALFGEEEKRNADEGVS